ncbi:hypothetical protein [Streptomyces sp. NPDC059949]|uniref:hypothetical protein n=1 Tax=Streptomyces sp. NPDC059949 TaxID=3347013 RepID=UPI003648D026
MAENPQQPRLPGEWPTLPPTSGHETGHNGLDAQHSNESTRSEPVIGRIRQEGARGLRPAEARIVATQNGDIHDPDRRPALHLVVTCPYCGHQHIHPAGHTGEPRLCPRNARCVGPHGGAYYFPAVQQ